ncbi:MAG: imidazolonepropionase [Planctomycetota bacterium]|jgi:imidazolonepropionase|nr:imidazolonepropionase [Planctomycetota bacterium]
MAEVGLVEDGAIAVRDGRVVATGLTGDLAKEFEAGDVIDLGGYTVLPGFVDCHTHPIFVSTRENEFHMRCAGADYMEIAQAGGGILNSAQTVRQASLQSLQEATLDHLQGFLGHGTTTVEAKSGYGLSTESEIKSLQALALAGDRSPLTIHRTFLGAHEFPLGYRETPDQREQYVRLLIDEMLPAARDLADSCDVFAEPGVFDRDQARRVMEAAKDLGYRLRMHVDEIEPMAGAELAVELGADSADHLACISLAGQEALASSETTAVLLPGTTFFLGKTAHAPARSLMEKGCAVALATDYNPGSCHTQSMPLIITLACILLKMTPEECIHATTINPAASLGLDHEIGSLHPGKWADMAVLDLPGGYRGLGYTFGGNPVAMTVKRGVVVAGRLHEHGEADRLPVDGD